MFNNLTVFWYYFIFIVLGIVTLGLAAFSIGHFNRLRIWSREKKWGWVFTSGVMFLLALISLYTLGTTYHTAKATGANTERYTHMTVADFKQSVAKSPHVKMPKTKLPKGSIIVLYRFNCKDCEAHFKQISHDFPASRKNVYYVTSRSKYGTSLIKKNHIAKVPTVIYITQDKRVFASGLVNGTKYDQHTADYYKHLMEQN